MSDESDDKRRPSPDATQPDIPVVEDATQADLPVPDAEETEVAEETEKADAATRGVASVPPPSDEDTLSGEGPREDDTLDSIPHVPAYQEKPTAVIPADDDWAPSRGNPAWSGRAEVRAPQPGRGYPEVDWAAAAEPGTKDRWWMPIVVGIIALILLALLGWAIYLIVQDSDSKTPVPAATTSTAAAPTQTAATTTTAQTTPPSSAPTTTPPITMPSTTEPTDTEVTVPALRGLALPAAQAALNATGLNYRLKFREVDAPAGTVVDSDPAEGQEVPPDTVVTLVVAAGATTVPTVTTDSTGGAGTGGQ
jgi:hypothetical protein